MNIFNFDPTLWADLKLSALSLTEIIDELVRSGKVTSTKRDEIKEWIKTAQITF